MIRKILYIFIVVALSIVFGGFLIYYFGLTDKYVSVSPLPDFLTLNKNSQVRFLDLWFPSAEKQTGIEEKIKDMTAKSALVYDMSTNKTIYEKDAEVKRPMASLAKIMTAIVAIENAKDDELYLVKKEDLVGENSMGLEEGEMLSLEELLYGLMLPSGNDASEVLASNFPTGRTEFIKAMNQKAEALGLKDTHFDNPSGLAGDGEQYTTVYDLLIITKYALETHPIFARVVSTERYFIPPTATHKEYDLHNETNLLTTYEGVKGVKTGYTPEAGLCLVTYIDYKGHKLIGVILNSENRRGEMINLLNFSLKTLGIKPPEYKG